MPIDISCEVLVALRKEYRMPNEPRLERSNRYSSRIINRVEYFFKQLGFMESEIPIFEMDDQEINEIIENYELNIEDLRENYYILVGGKSFYDSGSDWEIPDNWEVTDEKLYRFLFFKEDVVTERRNLVGDDLILLYALFIA